ncbi:signal transduction histidine kinase [Pontibacter aydingkolensis]|uniref:Uncharacterized protein n=1 Tax=Pontibacter aydingkolensis TaxID=1911536 RepID=A0ABS7CQ45_9BACT|nr:hypothetical protein [Pontibacter aydingkolensis]MBW7465967.1 hypothetical protein [Pontibacter aydingkolensis]
MRKYLCLLPLLLLTLTAQAQENTLATFNLKQESILRVGMLVLGGWAVLNILLASFKLTTTTRARRYFYQMNLYWNVVNLVIAGIALHHIISSDGEAMALAESIRQHDWYKKILYLNIGLDVAYIALGAYLQQRAKTSLMKPEQLMGWGQAVVLQGFFLLLLDVVLTVMLENISERLFRLVPLG